LRFLEIDPLGDRQALQIAAQTVEAELDGTQAHPVAAAITRARRDTVSLSVAMATQMEPPNSMPSGTLSRSTRTASAWLAPACARVAWAAASAVSLVTAVIAG